MVVVRRIGLVVVWLLFVEAAWWTDQVVAREAEGDAVSKSKQTAAAARTASLLTVDRIFGRHEFSAKGFSGRWDTSGHQYWLLRPAKGGGQDIVLVDAESGNQQVVVPASLLVPPGANAPLKVEGFWFSKDRSLVLIYTNSKRVWRRNTRGDYWVLDRAARQLWKLGGDAPPSTLMFAKFSPDGRYVAYVRDRSLYVEDLRDRTVRVLVKAESPEIINGTSDWVYEEELNVRDGFRWSPDGRAIAFWQFDTSGVPKFPLVNDTDSLYPTIRWIPYPKVGQRNSACRIGVVSLQTGEVCWMKLPGDPRNHYLARMGWADSSQVVYVEQLNRRQNRNRLFLMNAETGQPWSAVSKEVKNQTSWVLEDTDEAWVDVHDELNWLFDGRWFTWVSERDGWRHVYVVSRDGKQVSLVTPGSYDVVQLLRVDEQGRWAYFIASPDNPTQRYLFRVKLDGSHLQRLTPENQPGFHSYRLSPDCQFAFNTYSQFGQPPVVELVKLPSHQTVRVLQDNAKLRQKLAKLKLGHTELFRVDIGGGVVLDGWCILPPDFNPQKKYPLLVYVYGEPAAQTVLDRWGGENYLWHQMLAQRGYVIMSFDNRGTPAPRGRRWRKCIYKKLGTIGPQDQAAAVRTVLRQRPYLDPNRVGVWGWSGGGSSTLHAMFKFPDLYKVGISVAPVANQRYYDSIYQERYMGLPGDNVEGYLNGSPINFADRLQGDLLIIHGTGDDNCHFATTEMLFNELIKHNKLFWMMAYPNRTHAIRERKNTVVHLRETMTRFLLTHLPPGPREGSKPQKTQKK